MSQLLSSPILQSSLTPASSSSNPFRAPDHGARLAHLSDIIPPPRTGKVDPPEVATPAVTYSVYGAGASHLADFAKRVGVSAFKIGMSRFGVQNRIAGLARHQYAGYWGRSGSPVSSMNLLPGADNWFQIRLAKPVVGTSTDEAGIRFIARAIEFDLPGHIDPELVDQAIHALLANRSLSTFLKSDTGQIRLRNADVDPNAWFHTLYMNGDAPDRLVPSRELYVFDPNEDVPLLATGLSRLVSHFAQEQTYGCA